MKPKSTKKGKSGVFKKVPLEVIRRELEATGEYGKKSIDSMIAGLKASSIYSKPMNKNKLTRGEAI